MHAYNVKTRPITQYPWQISWVCIFITKVEQLWNFSAYRQIVHQIVIMIAIMMLQLRYAQPCICMNDLVKPGEVVVTRIGNANCTVYSSILWNCNNPSGKICLCIVNCLREQFCFQDICYFLIDQYKDKYALQHYDCFESNINIMMVRNNHN